MSAWLLLLHTIRDGSCEHHKVRAHNLTFLPSFLCPTHFPTSITQINQAGLTEQVSLPVLMPKFSPRCWCEDQ